MTHSYCYILIDNFCLEFLLSQTYDNFYLEWMNCK